MKKRKINLSRLSNNIVPDKISTSQNNRSLRETKETRENQSNKDSSQRLKISLHYDDYNSDKMINVILKFKFKG